MRFQVAWDEEVDILSITLGNLAESPGTQEVAPGVLVDVTPDGRLLGIEIMGASRKYPREELVRHPADYESPVSLADAAAVLGMTQQALRKACERGRLRAKKIGRNWTTTDSAIADYINSRAHAGPGSAATG